MPPSNPPTALKSLYRLLEAQRAEAAMFATGQGGRIVGTSQEQARRWCDRTIRAIELLDQVVEQSESRRRAMAEILGLTIVPPPDTVEVHQSHSPVQHEDYD